MGNYSNNSLFVLVCPLLTKAVLHSNITLFTSLIQCYPLFSTLIDKQRFLWCSSFCESSFKVKTISREGAILLIPDLRLTCYPVKVILKPDLDVNDFHLLHCAYYEIMLIPNLSLFIITQQCPVYSNNVHICIFVLFFPNFGGTIASRTKIFFKLTKRTGGEQLIVYFA